MISSKLTVAAIAERFRLENLTEELDLAACPVVSRDHNRLALQLTGFYEDFDAKRVQVIGRVECSYLATLSRQTRLEVFEKLFATHFPCLIICRGLTLPDEEEIRRLAVAAGEPVLRSERSTSSFISDLVQYLNEELAPSELVHGVLVDVFGEGVLLMGESGLGKSEAALELIQRGHRLVADDVVEVRKISDVTLIGQSPKVLENLLELRGIGIINIRELYGVQSVKPSQSIDLIVRLEAWQAGKDYSHIGEDEETEELLGNRVVCYSVPIRPGRNTAIIVEAAAICSRQRKLGYNTARELRARLAENIELRKNPKGEN